MYAMNVMPRPNTAQLTRAVSVAASELETDRAWVFEGKVWLRLGDGWHLAISPDDAGRFRLDACKASAISDTLWVLCEDESRLRVLVQEAREAATAVLA